MDQHNTKEWNKRTARSKLKKERFQNTKEHLGFQNTPSPLILTLPSLWDLNVNKTQLVDTRIKTQFEKPLDDNVSNLLT